MTVRQRLIPLLLRQIVGRLDQLIETAAERLEHRIAGEQRDQQRDDANGDGGLDAAGYAGEHVGTGNRHRSGPAESATGAFDAERARRNQAKMRGGRDAGTNRWQAGTVKTYGALVLRQRYQGSARVSETIAPGESML